MGKIYRALQRSGNVFYEKDVSKGALNENALTSMEKKALGRAGRYYRLKAVQKRALSQNVQMPSTNLFLHQEPRLFRLPSSRLTIPWMWF